MKKIYSLSIIALLVTILANHSSAQAPSWQWASRAGGISQLNRGKAICTDATGNVIVTGYFNEDLVIFGSDTLFNAHPGSGYSDIFVVKYSSAGTVLWAIREGGMDEDVGSGVTTDAFGNILLTGYFASSSVTFGSTTLTCQGGYNIFTVKYTTGGSVLWAVSSGGTVGINTVNGISVDSSGNAAIAGTFTSSSLTFGSDTLTNAGNYDMFVMKYSATGAVMWASCAGSSAREFENGMASDVNGNTVVTGFFESPSVTFGSYTLTNANPDSMDMFLVKYSPAGTVLWAVSAGGSNDDQSKGVTTDSAGNIVITGYFESDSITFGSYTLSNGGWVDMFIVKYSPVGNVLWARRAGGTSEEVSFAICSDASGNFFITGYFGSSFVAFGPDTVTNSGYLDIFVAKYSAAGTPLWAKSAVGTDVDIAFGIAAGADGGLAITGYFTSTYLMFSNYYLYNWNYDDIFVAKLYYPPPCSIVPDSIISNATNNTICPGKFVTLTELGGVLSAGAAFNWYADSCGGTSLGTGDYKIFSPTDTTTYYVRAEDSCGVTACVSITINVNSTIAPPTITGITAFCQGGSSVLNAGGGYTSYLWSTAANTQTITVSAPGTYTVTVTNGTCTASASVTVTIYPQPIPVITGNTSVCQGGSTTLDAGAGYAVYLWTTGATSQTINVSAANTYTVTVTNANSCTGSASKTVTVHPPPVPIITGNTTICQGNSTTLNVGSGYSSYLWSNATTTQTINVNSAGVYTVTVTNAFACSGSASITVTVNPNPVPVITGNTTICQGSSTTLNTGAGYSSYAWSTGSGAQTINVTIGGIYTVTVTDGNGCTGSASVTVTVHPNPVAVITPAANSAICAGDTVHFMANTGAGYTYQWFHYTAPIAGATNSFYNATANGAYKVEITDSNLCTDFSGYFSVIIVCPPPIDDPQRIAPGSGNEIVIVPNPASDEIEILNFPARTDISIHILSAIGEKVFTKQLTTGNQPLTIDISRFAKGVYFITIDDGKEKTIKKFVKN